MPEIFGDIEDLQFSQQQKDFVSFAIEGYKRQLNENFEGQPIKEKVGAMYDAIDSMNQDALNKPGEQLPSCKKGCAHCCHIMVAATEWEAITALEYMNHIGLKFEEKDLQKIETQALIPNDHAYMVHPDRKCVFLGEDNMCQIYAARPAACRNYYVFSDPKECDTYKQVGAGKVLSFFNLDTVPPILTLMEKSELKPFAVHLSELLKTENYKSNVLRNPENATPDNLAECQLHTGEQGQE